MSQQLAASFLLGRTAGSRGRMAERSGGSVGEAVGGTWTGNGQEWGRGSDDSGSGYEGMEGERSGSYGSWKTARSKKRKKKSSDRTYDTDEEALCGAAIRSDPEYKVFVKLIQEGATFDDWSPIQLTKALHKEFGEVRSAKKLRNGCLMITCKDEEQQRKATQVNKINNNKVKGSLVFDKKLVRGVISGIPLRESTDAVKENITNAKITDVKRLKTKRDGVVTDSLSMVLTFDEIKLPERVFIGYMSYEVKMYIPPPLRCYKCQRFGHVAAVYKGKQRCSKCSGEHAYGQCDKDARL